MYATTLDKKLTKYCKKFDIAKVVCSDEFSYSPTNETITYTVYDFNLDEVFIKLVNEKYFVDIRPFYFIFSLLHEVGHHMTLDDLTEEEMFNDMFCRQIIIPKMENEEECIQAYINLTAEDLATTWAIDYIDTHIKECIEIQNKIYKLINHIYKKKSFQKEMVRKLRE